MPLTLIRNDITTMKCDAIVNAAKNSLLGGGGVDGAIHRAAGPDLLTECRTIGGCPTGEARITKGYALPASYVVHTAGPVWHGGTDGEAELLASCYTSSLLLAAKHKCKSIAFPLISAGAYGYPKREAIQIAMDTISRFLSEYSEDMDVYLVLFDSQSFADGNKLVSDIRSFIDDVYVSKHAVLRSVPSFLRDEDRRTAAKGKNAATPHIGFSPFRSRKSNDRRVVSENTVLSLEEKLSVLDESFRDMLLRKIDESGMTDAECYKKANIDRKLFSKIRSNADYKPRKNTVLAFAFALEMEFDEAKEMLEKAGYALSHNNKFDIIVEYFFTHHIYNLNTINETLFEFDQMLIGV